MRIQLGKTRVNMLLNPPNEGTVMDEIGVEWEIVRKLDGKIILTRAGPRGVWIHPDFTDGGKWLGDFAFWINTHG